jgi:hypothetical protein
MQSRVRLLIVLSLGLWVGMPNRGVLAASHVCSELCPGGAFCDAECWLQQSDFDNGYPATTCGGQGYSCCGDGICDTRNEACNACTQDCKSVSNCGGCTSNDDCNSPYYVCNSAGECVPVSGPILGPDPTCGGACGEAGDPPCCGTDVCIGTPGLTYCGIPQTTYCSGSPSCASPDDCESWANYWGLWYGCDVKATFCDPGNGHCQFTASPDCPTETNVCEDP